MTRIYMYDKGTVSIERRGASLHFTFTPATGKRTVEKVYVVGKDRGLVLQAIALFSQLVGLPIPPRSNAITRR